ncbi:hypothetical protein JCM17380_31720 [Desulfosporosinus burensis]
MIILVTLPLAMIGVTGGLILTGQSFSITAFMGIIILVGIVVNNAIVFIDYVNGYGEVKVLIQLHNYN